MVWVYCSTTVVAGFLIMVGSHHLKELLMWMVKSSCCTHVPPCVCVCVLFQWWFIRIWKGWCSPVYCTAKTGRSPISFYPFPTDFSSLLNNGNGMGLRLRQCSAGAVKVRRRNALRGQVSAGGGAHCFHARLIGASVERPITGKKQQYIIPLRQRLEVLRVRECVWCMSDPGECNPIVLLWGDMMCVHISISAWAGLSVA